MKILGIDPGTAIVGWAVIDYTNPNTQVIDYGCVYTDKSLPLPQRLSQIYQKINEIIDKHEPDEMSVEDIYFATNAKTALTVGHARGVIILAGDQKKLPVISYTPLVIKQTICGDGKADKSQIQKMVKNILKLDSIPKPDDAADAMAIALTHAYSYKFKLLTK